MSPAPFGGGAESEFDRFFRAEGPRLLGQAYVFTGDSATAQDLVQESFLRAWQRWDEVSVMNRPDAWVRRVLYNLAVSTWRRGRRLVPLADVDLTVGGPHPDALALAAALRTLPRRQAQAIVLHDAAGLSAPEVATELGVPEGTVRSWLSRGRSLLAARLSDSDGDDLAKGAR
jgi:RNA polymerase sigma-70 factor, ECF subfamily